MSKEATVILSLVTLIQAAHPGALSDEVDPLCARLPGNNVALGLSARQK